MDDDENIGHEKGQSEDGEDQGQVPIPAKTQTESTDQTINIGKSHEKSKGHSPHKVGLAQKVSPGGRETRGHDGQPPSSKAADKCGEDSIHKTKPFVTDGARGIIEKSPYYSKLSLKSHSSNLLKKDTPHHFYRTKASKASLESKSLKHLGSTSKVAPTTEGKPAVHVQVRKEDVINQEPKITYEVQNEVDPSAQDELLDEHCYDLSHDELTEDMMTGASPPAGTDSPPPIGHEFNWATISSATRVTPAMKSWASLHASEPVLRDPAHSKLKDQAARPMDSGGTSSGKRTKDSQPDSKAKRLTMSVAQNMTRQLVTPTVTLWGDDEDRGRTRAKTGDVPQEPGPPTRRTSSLMKLRNLRSNASKIAWLRLWWRQFLLSWTRFNRKYRDIAFLNEYITNIEGRFGSGLAAFFIFVRHLLLMDVALALLWILFIIVPQAIHADYKPVKDNFYFKNLFDGENGMASTWFFYGNYDSYVGSYPLALVYMFVVILTYFGGLFVVLKSVAYAIHDEGGSSVEDTRYIFSRLVLGTWDYALTSNEAVETFSRGLKSVFEDHMSEIKAREEVKSRSKGELCLLGLRRSVGWIITMILLVGGCASIYYATRPDSLHYIVKEMGYDTEEDDKNLVIVYGPTVIFMLVNAIIPSIIYQLPKMEKYGHPKSALHVNIGRVFILQIANLASFVISTYSSADEVLNGCTGTLIGQQLYKLVILNTILGAVQTVVPRLLRFYWTHKKNEFHMAPVILSVIQRQALIWIGTLVCPVMPLLGVISMATMFSTNYVRVKVTCHAPKRRWNQARRNTFLMGLTAFTLFLILIPVSIIITRQDVITLGDIEGLEAVACGPFSNRSMIQVAVEYQQSKASVLASAMEIIFSSTIILPLILVLVALIYFQSMRVKWEKSRKKMLIAELMQEREESQDMRKRLHCALNEV